MTFAAVQDRRRAALSLTEQCVDGVAALQDYMHWQLGCSTAADDETANSSASPDGRGVLLLVGCH